MKNNNNELKLLTFVFITLVLVVGYQGYYLSFLNDKIEAEIDRANSSISKSTILYTETLNEKNRLEKRVKELESMVEVMVLPPDPAPWWQSNLLNKPFTIKPKKANFAREEKE